MAYYYKQPPMYDEELSNDTVYFLNWAFILQMFFGYWMFDNKQMFGNTVLPITETNSPNRSGHSIWDPIELNQAFPFLFTGIVFLMFFIGFYIYNIINAWKKKGTWYFDNANSYINSLSEKDREWKRTEERFVRENDGISCLPDSFYNKLLTMAIFQMPTALNQRNYIHNTCSYDILANQSYTERFQYIPVVSRSELDGHYFMSEKVREILNLPYLTREQLQNFEFSNKLFKVMNQKGKDFNRVKKNIFSRIPLGSHSPDKEEKKEEEAKSREPNFVESQS